MRRATPTARHSTSVVFGTPVAGQYTVIMRPRLWMADGTVPVVLYNGGYSAGAMNLLGYFAYMYLTAMGFVVVSGDCGDTPSKFAGTGPVNGGPGVWGYAQGNFDAYMDALVAFSVEKLGCSGEVLWAGGSHGGFGLNWVRQHQDIVKACAMVIPALDGQDVIDRDPLEDGVYPASILATHGGDAAWQARRPTHNPVEFAHQLTVPALVHASETDPICAWDRTQAFAAAHPDYTLVNTGDRGHSTQGVDWLAQAEFLEAHSGA